MAVDLDQLIEQVHAIAAQPDQPECWPIAMTEDEVDDFNERAAIMQFDGGLPKERAEAQAMMLVLEKRIT